MNAPDLSVLIVTFNSAAFVGECLHALDAACATHSFEVIVADNASADGSALLVRTRHPEAIVIDMGRNAGFSRANNAALGRSRGRHIALINGDAVCGPGSLDALIDLLDEDASIGVVAPALLNPDGSDQGTARSFPTPAAAVFGRRSFVTRAFPANRWSRRYLSGEPRSHSAPFDVDWVSGACMMLPRSVIDAVGPLDEGFFMYWEDADWCWRVKASGRRVVCVPSARVVHAEGSSSHARPVRQSWYFHRSAYRFYAKHQLQGARSLLRPVAAALLGARLIAVVGSNTIARRTRPHAESPRETLQADSPVSVRPR